MAKRYIPAGSFTTGRGRTYLQRWVRKDGTQGYVEEELEGLSKAQKASFRVVEVSGEHVEEATAAPGEKRFLPSHECSVDGCDFTSRTAAGIAAHERSH